MVDGRWVSDQATSFELETSPLLKWGTSVCLVLGAQALFGSATIDDAGVHIRNLHRPEVIANWDQVQEIQITWGWANCRITFADGSRCRIWACTSPMTWQVLIDAKKWLETYDSPLGLKSHRIRQVTFRHDSPPNSMNS